MFQDFIGVYLEISIRDLKFSKAYTFEKARRIRLELRRKRGMIRSINKRNINSTKYF